jgi:regulator of cell morphogenesis and NO signaling
MNNTLEQTVRQIATQNPRSIRAFETLGIDYCCGGNRTLADACAHAKVSVERAMELLDKGNRPDETSETAGLDAWTSAQLRTLTGHIVQQHHRYVREETPRVEGLFGKVVARYGAAHPEIKQLSELFAAMTQELAAHMLKEEQVLFPYVERMEAARETHTPLPDAFFGSVSRPIAAMTADHDDAGALLARMRDLSGGYELPRGACPTYTALYHGLQEFERDLHRHVHLENNILFPRAIEMERQFVETPSVVR